MESRGSRTLLGQLCIEARGCFIQQVQ